MSISGTGTLSASFTFSPLSPQPGQPVTFDATSSSGGPTQYAWDFGDGITAAGPVVSHTYTTPGGYTVRLTISRSGSTATAQRGVSVASNLPPPPDATFQTSAPCASPFGIEQCQAETGAAVSFTATAGGAAAYTWDFADGTTATGQDREPHLEPGRELRGHPDGEQRPDLRHLAQGLPDRRSERWRTGAWRRPGPGPGSPQDVLLPWIAETSGALVQTTDLYVFNPGSAAVDVTLEFRKRGTPDVNPPRATRTIAPGATLFAADVLKDLFGRENVSGFLRISAVVTAGSAPVVGSFNTTLQGSSRFGQTVPALSLGGTVPGTQSLVGLSDDAERLSYFGISNPNGTAATYRVHFFNAAGTEVAFTPDLTLRLTASGNSRRRKSAPCTTSPGATTGSRWRRCRAGRSIPTPR